MLGPRELFKKGYRWKVGNGNHIVIDKDLWINRSRVRSPCLTNTNLKGKRVNKNLIDDNNAWKDEVIYKTFPIKMQKISSIRPSETETRTLKMKSYGTMRKRDLHG